MDEDKELAALYQPQIRELAARMRNDKRLSSPHNTVTCRSPVCGSTLTLDVCWTVGAVCALGWRSRACSLGMASTAIFVASAIGQTPSQIKTAGMELKTLLSGEDTVFSEPWTTLSVFSAARGFPTRHGSILLPFEALAHAWLEKDAS